MPKMIALVAVVLLVASPWPVPAQDARTTLERASRALGGDTLKSLQYSGSGVSFAIGQSGVPDAARPRFNTPSFARTINYETASLREEQVRSRAEMPPRGGGVPSGGRSSRSRW